jgi:Zn-finger nucleic acid-binding protein
MELTCPKCHGPMRTYERNGVHVDQCTECRGIFLDRGELERLIDAENAWHDRPHDRPREDRGPAAASQHGGSGYGGSGQQHGSGQGSGYASTGSAGGLGAVVNEVISQVSKGKSSSHSSYGHGHQKKRKESFLSDLFG